MDPVIAAHEMYLAGFGFTEEVHLPPTTKNPGDLNLTSYDSQYLKVINMKYISESAIPNQKVECPRTYFCGFNFNAGTCTGDEGGESLSILESN